MIWAASAIPAHGAIGRTAPLLPGLTGRCRGSARNGSRPPMSYTPASDTGAAPIRARCERRSIARRTATCATRPGRPERLSHAGGRRGPDRRGGLSGAQGFPATDADGLLVRVRHSKTDQEALRTMPAIGSVVKRSTGGRSRPSSRSAIQRGIGVGSRTHLVRAGLRVQRVEGLRVHPKVIPGGTGRARPGPGGLLVAGTSSRPACMPTAGPAMGPEAAR